MADLPHSIEAEQAFLGALLYDNSARYHADGIQPRHFYEPVHGRILHAVDDLMSKERIGDILNVRDRLADDPALIELGGLDYLMELWDKALGPERAGDFAQTIIELSTRRDLIAAAQEAVSLAAGASDKTAAEQIALAERRLSEIAHGSNVGTAWLSAGAVTLGALRMAQERRGMVGLSTGLRELDEATGGLRRGQMFIVAGRPGMAKSTAALQLAKACALQGKGALFFSMEMPDVDLGLRMACDLAYDRYPGGSGNASYFEAARGGLRKDQWEALEEAQRQIDSWPLAFDVRPGLTVSTMQAAARRKFREWERQRIEPGVIIVDHLTIARPDQDRRGNKVAEVSDISRGLAEMAKTLDVPMVALCQLSRDVEKRDSKDRRPTLSDLRWSGDIEQDARCVTFLYRPEYYVRRPEDETDFQANVEFKDKLHKVRHKLFWLIEKNNNGPTGQVETFCDIACSAIRDRVSE